MDLGLTGRRVLITGASKGIGAGCALAFAAEGCNLALVARDALALDGVAAGARGLGVDVRVFAMDLTVAANLDKLAAANADVDVLVNNAGASPGGNLATVDEATWRAAWDLKVFGYINLSRAFYAHMKARGRGVIINDIGAAGERHDADYIAGSTANAGLMAFSRALGGRSLEDGIRVLGVNPGPVATDRIVSLMKTRATAAFGDDSRWEEFTQRFPLGRAARVAEIADTIVFLASDRASYTSGTIITIDGGISARNSM